MIPKKIHFCWFSGDKYPALIEHCIKSWEKHLPDYEIKLWNFDSFPKDKSDWVREAVENKKYAFAADYIRAYALYTEGGIYLDSDVEVLKSFNPLLDRPYFIGHEKQALIEAAVIGSEKGNPLFKKLLDYYSDRRFVKSDGSLDIKPLPEILKSIVLSEYTTKDISDLSLIPKNNKELFIFPAEYFSPKSLLSGKVEVTESTFCIHHFDGGWLNSWEKAYRFVRKYLGANIANVISKLIKKIK